MIVFVTAMLLLNITPGPDMLYVIARSVGQGRAAGIASALGVGAGCFFHIFAVAFGVAELLRTVPVAYQAIRYAGAAYLIYLGVRMLFAKGGSEGSVVLPRVPPAVHRPSWFGVPADGFSGPAFRCFGHVGQHCGGARGE